MEQRSDITERVALYVLLMIIIAAAWIRFDGLGQFGFWTDELYHAIAAQSLLEGGEPMIPARGMYWRAFPVTAITAACFTIFGESEWSARVPFAVLSLVMLIVVYKVLATHFTRLLALITVLLMALTPQFVQAGRECRMYIPFVLFYFLFVFSVYRWIEPSEADNQRPFWKTLTGLILPAVLFLAAGSMQYLAVNFGFTMLVYCVLMTGYVASTSRFGRASRSRYAILTALMVIGPVTAVLMSPPLRESFIQLATMGKSWDTQIGSAPFCLWFFDYYYPALWYLYPLGAVIIIHRYGRLGVFMVCAFIPVLFAHMFVLTSRIAERYLLYILPFFFLVSASVIESLIQASFGWIKQLRLSGARMTAWAAMLCLVPAGAVFFTPWLTTSLDLIRYGQGPDWKQIAPQIQEACEQGIVITTWPREVRFYGGRFPDHIATQSYERNGDDTHEVLIGENTVTVRYLTEDASLQQILEANDDVYFITTDWAFQNDAFLTEPMRMLIQQQMSEIASVSSGNDRVIILRIH